MGTTGLGHSTTRELYLGLLVLQGFSAINLGWNWYILVITLRYQETSFLHTALQRKQNIRMKVKKINTTKNNMLSIPNILRLVFVASR